jgi:hypothetical protein
MRTRNSLFLLALLAGLSLAPSIRAQEHSEYEEPASPKGVLIGLKGGVILTTPRRELPSLRIGESVEATGGISSRYGETGLGHRYGVELLIPFNEKMALSTEFGVQTYVVKYRGDTGRPDVRLDVQILQAVGALAGNLYVDRDAFATTGLRNVYISGGFELGVETIRNRVQGFSTSDSDPTRVPAVGSFDNTEPFRNLFGLRLGAGVRYGIDWHWELSAEGAYTFMFNPVFSSDVVRDNGFTVDNLALQLGLGHRF